MIDWTFRIGDVLTLGGLAAAAIFFLNRLESQLNAVRVQTSSLGETVKKVEGQMETVATALVEIAVQDERLNSHGMRLAQLEIDIRRIDGRAHDGVDPR